MPRCTSTNQFASYDEPELDVESESIDAEGHFEATVRCVRPCADCGEEMAEYTFEVDGDAECAACDAEEPAAATEEEAEADDATGEWEIEIVEAEPNERQQTEDRHGKPIKNPRYARRYLGVDVTFDLRCPKGHVVTAVASDETTASSFDVLV